jgi:hypothetical protein
MIACLDTAANDRVVETTVLAVRRIDSDYRVKWVSPVDQWR